MCLFVLFIWWIMVSFLSNCKTSLNIPAYFRLSKCLCNVVTYLFENRRRTDRLLFSNPQIVAIDLVDIVFFINVIIKVFFAWRVAILVRTLFKRYQVLYFIFPNMLLNFQLPVRIFEKRFDNARVLFQFYGWVKVFIYFLFRSFCFYHEFRLTKGEFGLFFWRLKLGDLS